MGDLFGDSIKEAQERDKAIVSPLVPSIEVHPEVAKRQKEMLKEIKKEIKEEAQKEKKKEKPIVKNWYGGLLDETFWELGNDNGKIVFWTIQDKEIKIETSSIIDVNNNLILTIPKKVPWILPDVYYLKNEVKPESLEWENIYSTLKELVKDQIFLIDEEYYDIIALWIILTYYTKHIKVAPYLLFLAEKISGKTTALKMLADFCYRGVVYEDISNAALVRELQNKHIIPLMDEATEQMLEAKDLKGALLCGNMKNISYVRVSEKDFNDTESWDVFCLKALASPSPYSDHLMSRCITISMAQGAVDGKATSEMKVKLLSILYYLKLVCDSNDTSLSTKKDLSLALSVTHMTLMTDNNNNNNNNNIYNNHMSQICNIPNPMSQICNIPNPRIKDLFRSLLSVTSVISVPFIMENIFKIASKLCSDISVTDAESTDAKIVEVFCQLGQCSAGQIKKELALPPYELEHIASTTIGRRLKALGFIMKRESKQRVWTVELKRLQVLLRVYGLEDIIPNVNNEEQKTLNEGDAVKKEGNGI